MSEDPDSVPERDMKDFQFRQMKKVRVFESPDDLPKDRSSLLAVSNKFGLTFVGQGRTLKVFHTKDIVDANKIEGDPNQIVEGVKSIMVIVERPMHNISLSCDELTLCVCGMSEEWGVLLAFYDVRTFINKSKMEKLPFASLRPAVTQGTLVQDLKWNPVQATVLAACLSNGNMMVLEVSDKVTVQAELPASEGVTCICWSPKGKQVAAGKQNATVVQYTPALQEKKVIPCPNFYNSDNPVKVLDVQWLSTFVFAVAYAAADGSLETPPELVLVSLPKKDEKKGESYLNFNEVVYGSCTERQHHYFLCHIEEWNLFLAASAAAIDVSIIAKQEDKLNWELWVLEDASRAELPVTLDNEDTLPVGVAIDFTSQEEIRISEEIVLPPAPTLMLLSTDGVLCPFSLVNQIPNVKQLSITPVSLSLEGERVPVSGAVSAPPATFSAPSITLTSSSSLRPLAPAVTSVVAGPSPSATSMGFSFAPPSSQSSAPSIFSMSSSSFSFGSHGAKPTTELSSAPTSSFSPLPTKSLAENNLDQAPVAQHGTSISPATVSFKVPVDPATPSVKMNLTERFSAAVTPRLGAGVFSTPRPPFSLPKNQSTPLPSASKSAASPGPLKPFQGGAPQTALPKGVPSSLNPNDASASQLPVFKTQDKQVKPKKECDLVMAGILEEIAHFEKELDDLKARSAKADFRVGTAQEMKELRKDSEDLHIFTLEIKETTESLHGDISALKTTVLEGFAGANEGKSQHELSKDKGYLQLLCKKPLDPRSEDQLKEIRRLYQYVKFAVEDVNDVLDLEWEKHLEKKKKQKHFIVPEREALFIALANNLDIINQQKKKLEILVNDLQTLRLYNKTSPWNRPNQTRVVSQQSVDSELENLRDALMKASLESIPQAHAVSPAKMSPVKQTQLRNFLSKRQRLPVRSTAPANLSRSAFLSPNYYENLDDASSTSSLSQPIDHEDSYLRDDEEEAELVPAPLQSPSVLRHPTVVRTSSIQTDVGMLSQFGKVQPGLGPVIHPDIRASKISAVGADSTAFATKTVKHGAPPVEKNPPVTMPAQQAAANAALRRQMASQKPAVSTALTESTLKTVPQVVNVLDLKNKGVTMPISTVISSSVPAPAAQVVQQVLATVGTNQAKRTQTSTPTPKVSVCASEISTAPQSGFVFAPATGTSVALTSTAGPAFPAPPFPSTMSVSQPSQGSNISQAKDASQAAKFSFTSNNSGGGLKFFGGGGDTPFSFTPKTSAPTLKTSNTTSPTPSISAGLNKLAPNAESQALPVVSGETLGIFSELRVGQSDEEVKEAPKAAAGFAFIQSEEFNLSSGFQQQKPTEPLASNAEPVVLADEEPPKTAATSNVGITSTISSAALNILETTTATHTKPVFSINQPNTSAPAATSFTALLVAPLPSTTAAPCITEPTADPAFSPAPSQSPPEPIQQTEASPNVDTTGLVETRVPEKPPSPPHSASLAPLPAESNPEAPNASETPAVLMATTTTATTSPFAQVLTSDKPGSIFSMPSASTSATTLGVNALTIAISTAVGTSAAPTASVSSSGSVFGQTTGASTGFGSSAFGGFGKPSFGQPSGFGPPSSSSGFGFTQTGFGSAPVFSQPPAVAPSSSGAGLFGSSGASSASSFSFASSSTANSGNLFGQTGAPAFGQQSFGFGQGSLFGSNTTTTSSSGFSFGQPSAFGSTSTPSVFGQQSGSSSVFGQPSSGGGLFGPGASNTGTPASSGGFFSGLGGKPSEDAANKNPFGSTPSGDFGQPSQGTSSLFGNSGAKTFGFSNASFVEQKSSGMFSGGGGGSVASQGFGSFNSPAKPGGFGSAPVFGSPPSFGGSPAFGAPSAFGSPPAFSNPMGSAPNKVFGEGTAAANVGGFGFATAPSAPTFGSLANQNTPSFGNLAQQNTSFGSQNSSFSGFGSSGGFPGGFGSTNQLTPRWPGMQ